MSDPTTLRARAGALRLHGLLAHWPDVVASDWVAALLDWEEQERGRQVGEHGGESRREDGDQQQWAEAGGRVGEPAADVRAEGPVGQRRHEWRLAGAAHGDVADHDDRHRQMLHAPPSVVVGEAPQRRDRAEHDREGPEHRGERGQVRVIPVTHQALRKAAAAGGRHRACSRARTAGRDRRPATWSATAWRR